MQDFTDVSRFMKHEKAKRQNFWGGWVTALIRGNVRDAEVVASSAFFPVWTPSNQPAACSVVFCHCVLFYFDIDWLDKT